MIFVFNITTPANTTAAVPKITELPIAKGVIHRWQIFIPSGQQGTCKLQVKRGSDPVIPTNPEGYISGDNFVFHGEDWIYAKNSPFRLQAITWNSDTKYAHEMIVHIFIKELWTFSPFSEQFLNELEQTELLRIL